MKLPQTECLSSALLSSSTIHPSPWLSSIEIQPVSIASNVVALLSVLYNESDSPFLLIKTPNPFSSSSFPLALLVYDSRHGDCVCAGVAVGRVTTRSNAYGTLGAIDSFNQSIYDSFEQEK